MNQPSLVTTLPLTPSRDTGAHRGLCPFASNCACVFSRNVPDVSVGAARLRSDAVTNQKGSRPEALADAVADWRARGFRVTSDAVDEVALERRIPSSFCTNAFLVAFTGFLWLIPLVLRSRRPRIEIVRLSVSSDGNLLSDRRVIRQQKQKKPRKEG